MRQAMGNDCQTMDAQTRNRLMHQAKKQKLHFLNIKPKGKISPVKTGLTDAQDVSKC